MKRVTVPLFALLCLVPRAGYSQMATVRGLVLDDNGKPVPDVKVEMEFKGESRQKIVKTVTTDKKGGFVRAGLPSGPYKITFSKEGYRPYGIEMTVSLGGLSEIPDVVLKAVPAAGPAMPEAAGGPGTSAAPAAPETAPVAEAQRAQLGEAFTKALEATKTGQLDEAESLYKGILDKYPTAAAVHFNLGYVHRRKKEWSAAEADYRKVMELEASRSDAYVAMGALYEESGRGDEALEFMKKAAPQFEPDARFQFAFGAIALNAGQPDLAEKAFSKAQTLDPNNPEVHFHLGTLAVGQNDVPKAISHLEQYLALTGQNPKNLDTARKLLEALKAMKR
jgi:Flp pilus assembly protein TadD